ncbi:hydrogenase maturation nickel metallochaperone HypA, partial [Patescibacteria group bacterium]|nr:hydrogenase maturation nickel metallochaperone HypA [Patescibacteria group bacterium]
PVVVHCNECGLSSTIEKPPFVCSKCGNGGIEIVSGRELMVVSIELADEEPDTSTER